MGNYSISRQCNSRTASTPCLHRAGFFFNRADHLAQQSQAPRCTLTVLNQLSQQVEARCTFFLEAGNAVSPAAAPFGSIEFSQALPDAVLTELIDAVVEEAKRWDCHSLRLVNYPNCYAPEQAERLTQRLGERGFRIKEINHSFYFTVTTEPFCIGLSPAEHRRLRKCQRAGFRFEHWIAPNPEVVTTFLATSYEQRHYTLSVSCEKLSALLQQFTNEFQVFVVCDGPVPIAMAVTVRVRDDILYTFLPASLLAYRSFSPMVMLIDGLFAYCQQHDITLLDLGVSLDADRCPKPSLSRFKRNLGAMESPKLIFEKEL